MRTSSTTRLGDRRALAVEGVMLADQFAVRLGQAQGLADSDTRPGGHPAG